MSLKLVVWYGSVRSKRLGIRVARFVTERCRARGHEVTLLDARELALPLLDRMFKEYGPGEAPPALQRMADAVAPADAHIVVSAEYNHAPPPGLTNMLDHFLDEFFHRVSGIVCYSPGPFGGVRAGVALRPMLAELGMSSIPSMLPVSRVHQSLDADGNALDEAYPKRADKFLDELEWYAEALKAAREGRCCERAECEAARSV